MRNDSTVYVGLDVHKESIVAAYAVGYGEVQEVGEVGEVGIRECDWERLCLSLVHVPDERDEAYRDLVRAWNAQLRLCRRFRRLITRGKHHNVALVAVARELAGFIWDIARRVPVTAA